MIAEPELTVQNPNQPLGMADPVKVVFVAQRRSIVGAPVIEDVAAA